MNVEPLSLPEVLLVKPRVYSDLRGRFLETWRADAYGSIGIGPFVQENLSHSNEGVLRGLHLQHPKAQGKLVSVSRGRAFDVAVDVRTGSPTFGSWVGVELDEVLGWQLWIPPGFAHGFVALSEVSFSYRCTDYYAPDQELIVRWDDPLIGIRWPVSAPVLSHRDACAPLLRDISPNSLPTYDPKTR